MSMTLFSLPPAVSTLLSKEFAMSNLGPIHYFLGIVVQRTKHSLFLHQATYTTNIIQQAGMTNCKPSPTPFDIKSKLSSSSGPPISDRITIAALREHFGTFHSPAQTLLMPYSKIFLLSYAWSTRRAYDCLKKNHSLLSRHSQAWSPPAPIRQSFSRSIHNSRLDWVSWYTTIYLRFLCLPWKQFDSHGPLSANPHWHDQAPTHIGTIKRRSIQRYCQCSRWNLLVEKPASWAQGPYSNCISCFLWQCECHLHVRSPTHEAYRTWYTLRPRENS